jgi:hypothetical protein
LRILRGDFLHYIFDDFAARWEVEAKVGQEVGDVRLGLGHHSQAQFCTGLGK